MIKEGDIIIGIDLGNNNSLFTINIMQNGVGKTSTRSAINGEVTNTKLNTDLLYLSDQVKKNI